MNFEELEQLENTMEDSTQEERMQKLKEFFPNLKIKSCRMGESPKGANKYRLTISNGSEQFTSTFTDSLYNTYNNTKSSNFEMLYCIVVDAQCYEQSRTFEDFCDNVCYDLEDKRARKCYEGCRRTYENIERLFGYEGYEIINAITYGF